jgi:integrase
MKKTKEITTELTVVKNEVGCYSENMNNKISGYVWNIQEELPRNTELQQRVVQKVVEKKIVDEIEYNYDISYINISEQLSDYLNLPKLSDTTKKNYKKWLNDYLLWCNTNGIDCRKITRMEAQGYLSYLFITKKYSPNSTRSMILSVSSFYTFLSFRFPKIITKNMFFRLDLPTIKPVRNIDKVTESDIAELRKELKRIGRKDIICAIDIIVKYGFRVGIFENMKIDSNGNWNSVSKEKCMTGKFLKGEVKKINESGLLLLRKSTIQNTVKRYTDILYKSGKISCSFSIHDLRHYMITKNAKGLSADDFLKFSRKFHKNVNTTYSYINS